MLSVAGAKDYQHCRVVFLEITSGSHFGEIYYENRLVQQSPVCARLIGHNCG